MDYEKDIRIDENSLDVEWLDQASLMVKYGMVSARARADMDRAKEKLDLVKAELDKEIRSNPEAFDITVKVTEAVVENTILMQDEYKEAVRELADAKFENDMAYAAVKAVDARKDALENLVRLHGQQYFAGPKVPRDLSFEAQQKHNQKKSNAAVGAMTRKTK